MRLYFLSRVPAALKLNGIYLGTVDGFERHIELDPEDKIFAEFLPADNLQPINCFLDGNFLKSPPPFADVYLTEGDAVIYIRGYEVKQSAIKVIYQTRFCGNLITVFSQGAVYLSAEGVEYALESLPQSFCEVRAETKKLAGREVLAIYGGSHLLIINDSGKVIFLNEVESAEFGESLAVTTPFETCTAAKSESVFSFDGNELTLISAKTVETRPPEKEILHFAFFESVLTRGSFANYLDSDLRARAGDLQSYLGKFVSVTVPPEKFYSLHGNIPAAGLVYPKSKNLFEIKYFAVDFNGDKISNIYPVD